MAKVVDMFSRRDLGAGESQDKDREMAEEREKVAKLTAYLEDMDTDKALETREECGPDYPCPRDLKKMDLEKTRTVTPDVAERLILDCLKQAAPDLAEDPKKLRAINNLLQLRDAGKGVEPRRAGLALGPYNPVAERLYEEIRQKKAELLQAEVDGEIMAELDKAKEAVASYGDQAWGEEFHRRMGEVKFKTRRTDELLDMVQFIRTMDFRDPGKSVRELSQMREKNAVEEKIGKLRQALKEGDPAAIKGHADQDMEMLAENERRWRSEIVGAAAKVQMQMLRDRIALALRQPPGLRVVEE